MADKCKTCVKLSCKGCKVSGLMDSLPETATIYGLNQFPKVKDLEGKLSRSKK